MRHTEQIDGPGTRGCPSIYDFMENLQHAVKNHAYAAEDVPFRTDTVSLLSQPQQ